MKKIGFVVIIGIGLYFFASIIFPNYIGIPLGALESNSVFQEKIKESTTSKDSVFTFPKPIGFVNDFEGILTVEENNHLETKISAYTKETTNEIAIVTIASIDPYTSLQEYTVDLANEWGVGQKGKDNGLIIMICNSLREIRIATGTGTEKILTDSICQTIIQETIVPEFKNGDYYKGLDKGLNELIKNWK